MRHEVNLCENVTPPPYSKILFYVMKMISGLILAELKHFFQFGSRNHPSNGIYK